MAYEPSSSYTKQFHKTRQMVAPPVGNGDSIPTSTPQFGQPTPSPDPDTFVIKHGSDSQAYKILDTQKQFPRSFPVVAGTEEPALTLEASLGSAGKQILAEIQKAGQIVFHAVGDTGNVKGPANEESVADKMVADFDDANPREVPSFFFHLGDVVYSFGEAKYYYDQFYDIFRDYPAPIFAVAGNHDGMVAPKSDAQTLGAFIDNFCTAGQPPHRTPESGELVRTAQIQPGVYFTLEVPFVRILALYSNSLEDPGVISDQGGAYAYLGQTQLRFLRAAFERIKAEGFSGAVVIAVHHPPYAAGHHGGSPEMLREIDVICADTGVWPHAVLSGHAHNYQRFTRNQDERETPFIVAGNGGHAVMSLTRRGTPAPRTPVQQDALSNGADQIVFENYDDQGFGYMRIVVNPQQLRIEYHPAADGARAKTPDDAVTVDLKSRKIVHYAPQS